MAVGGAAIDVIFRHSDELFRRIREANDNAFWVFLLLIFSCRVIQQVPREILFLFRNIFNYYNFLLCAYG